MYAVFNKNTKLKLNTLCIKITKLKVNTNNVFNKNI